MNYSKNITKMQQMQEKNYSKKLKIYKKLKRYKKKKI